MKLRVLMGLVALVVLVGMAVPASAQSTRPTIAVMDFDYSAVNNWWSGVWGNYDVGKGVADMVVDDSLVEPG